MAPAYILIYLLRDGTLRFTKEVGALKIVLTEEQRI